MKSVSAFAIKVILVVASFVLMNGVCAGSDDRPRNYNEIKSLFEAYAMADDLLDEELIRAREKMYHKGDEATPVLFFLFRENADEQYRARIVDVFKNGKGRKDLPSVFLVEQLQGSADQWKGAFWIDQAIAFLTKADPERARIVARKALFSPDLTVKHAAIRSIASVGKEEDIKHLKQLIHEEGHSQPEGKTQIHEKAEEAIEKVKAHAMQKK